MARSRRFLQAATRIEVHKTPTTRYRSTLHRDDGVSVALEGGSWNRIGGEIGRVPHDLAHLVVEEELGIAGGLWGLLAGGGLVKNAEFVGGRRPPHSARKARQITAAAREELLRTEVLVRLAADLSVRGATADLAAIRRDIGERWWDPRLTTEAFARIDSGLRAYAVDWDALPANATLEVRWTGPHAAPVPRRRTG